MPLSKVFPAIIMVSLITFLTRAFSFILYSRRKPPEYILFIEKYIPPMVMVILVFYSLSAVNYTASPHGIPEIVSVIFVFIVHTALNNPLYSIFGGTILYMILSRIIM